MMEMIEFEDKLRSSKHSHQFPMQSASAFKVYGGKMGGMGDTCRGKTKLACYKNFRREVNRKEIEEGTTCRWTRG